MKNIFVRKAIALLGAVMLCMSLAVPALAVDTLYTPVAGTSTTFQKALVLDKDANVPTIQFAYSIAPGTAVAASNGKMEIIAPSVATGVTGTPSIANVSYAPGDATVTTAEGVTLTAEQKAALKTATVDFSGVTFAEPGIYRYLITETSADQQGMTYDTQLADKTNGVAKQRTLDVYVTDSDGSLVVSNYVIHELVNDIAAGNNNGSDVAATLADKSKGFVNEYATVDLTLSKTVTGNQGSQDKYFKFTVAITNAGANANLNVDMSGAQTAPAKSVATVYSAEEMAAANSADDNANVDGQQWATDASGAVTKTVYLKHNQSIVIKGLASGAKYTITEVPEDYKCDKANNQVAETNGMTQDATVEFQNTRDGIVPTGVIVSAAGGIALALAGIGGAGYAVVSRRKNKEDDED